MKCKIFVFRLNFKTSNNFMNRKNFFNEMICLSPQCIRWKNRNVCMNSVRFKVLSCLCEHDVLTPIEISKLIGVHKNNVSRE